MIWITSDTHFWHHRICAYCSRPFLSVEDMNEELIRRWNSKVKSSDFVFHCGDFALVGKDEWKIGWLLEQLNGRLLLVLGNHDRAELFRQHGVRMFPSYAFDSFILTHIPLEEVPLGFVNLCGHTHQACWGSRIQVGVDVWDFTPQTLESLIAIKATGVEGTDPTPYSQDTQTSLQSM